MTAAPEIVPPKEHPRLFSGAMVRAILEDRKSQTRRLVARANSLVDGSPCPKTFWERLDFSKAWADPGPSPAGNPGPYLKVPTKDGESTHRISEDDARAEGVTPIPGTGGAVYPGTGAYRRLGTHRDAFKKLWDELNGKGDPWCSAPWVWVVGFRRVKP